jgi:hypothetical protein
MLGSSVKTILLPVLGLSAYLVAIGQVSPATNQPPSDAEIRRMIIGTWGVDGNDVHGRTTFATNGTYSYTNWVTGRRIPNSSPYGKGVWRVEDGACIATATNTGNSRLDPVGIVRRTKFLFINETGMVGVTQFGNTNTMARIK